MRVSVAKEQLIERYDSVDSGGMGAGRESHCRDQHHLYRTHALVVSAHGERLCLVAQVLLVIRRDAVFATRELYLADLPTLRRP